MGKAKPVVLATRVFAKRGDASDFFKTMLNSYKPGDWLSDADAADVESLLDRHPNKIEKVGLGIHHFEVQSAAEHPTQCFAVVRKDGTSAQFSYPVCIAPERYPVRDS